MDVVGTRSQGGGKSALVHGGGACLGEGISLDVVAGLISYRWLIQACTENGR
jgi:hypothetical protein